MRTPRERLECLTSRTIVLYGCPSDRQSLLQGSLEGFAPDRPKWIDPTGPGHDRRTHRLPVILFGPDATDPWGGGIAMRMGLLADIHEDVDRLAMADRACRQEGADRLFTLGDIFETGGGSPRPWTCSARPTWTGSGATTSSASSPAGAIRSSARLTGRPSTTCSDWRPGWRSRACSWAMSCPAWIPPTSRSHGTSSEPRRPPRPPPGTSPHFPTAGCSSGTSTDGWP